MLTIAPRVSVEPHVPGRVPMLNPRPSTSGESATVGPLAARIKRTGTTICFCFLTFNRIAITLTARPALQPGFGLRSHFGIGNQILVDLKIEQAALPFRAEKRTDACA